MKKMVLERLEKLNFEEEKLILFGQKQEISKIS